MRRAFTLIELLVVIAIIAILAAILFPVFSQAKVTAIEARGLSQARQLSLAVMTYANDHDDFLVPSTNYDAPTDSESRIWTVPLFPYVQNRQIFVSPAAGGSAYAEGWSTRHRQSVGMNGAAGFGTTAGLDAEQVCAPGELKTGCEGFGAAATYSTMERPSASALFADTPFGEPGTKYRGYVISPDNGVDPDDFSDLELAVPLVSDRDLVAELGDREPRELKPVLARYGATGDDDGSTPVIFADGHAETFSARALQSSGSGVIWRFR